MTLEIKRQSQPKPDKPGPSQDKAPARSKWLRSKWSRRLPGKTGKR